MYVKNLVFSMLGFGIDVTNKAQSKIVLYNKEILSYQKQKLAVATKIKYLISYLARVV